MATRINSGAGQLCTSGIVELGVCVYPQELESKYVDRFRWQPLGPRSNGAQAPVAWEHWNGGAPDVLPGVTTPMRNAIAGVPVEQLVRRVEPDEQPPLAYARSIVEYCSYVALRAETRRRHDHLGDREFHSLTYDMMLAWEAPDHDTDAELQVDGRRTVGPEAFAKIAPACPAMAHPITVRNLFDALTNSTGGRLHFLIYHKYLTSLDDVLRSTKCISGGHKAPALDLCDGEVVLDIFGAATTQPVLQHIGTSTWPGRLTLTNHALYFEAIGVDFSYGDAVVYDLTKDLKQCVKRESTGPWGAHLFDKAVMYKSSSMFITHLVLVPIDRNEPVFFEFPQFKGHSRRDYWFAVIKEVLHAHKFIRRYRLVGFQKAEALAVATLGILRYRAVKEGFHILPAYFKTTLAFNLAEKLPKGDKILEALYGQLQEHCSRFRGGDDLAAQGSSDELALADPFPLSAFTLVRMGLLTLRKEDNPEERDFAVGDVQIGRTSSVQMALERSVGYSGRVEAARATLDQVKVEDIDTNVAVLKELVFPLIEIGKRLVFLAEWEDPLKSYVFLLCFLYVVYRGLIWYIFPGFLVGSTAFMLWNKHHGNRHFIEAFEVTTPPRRRTVEQLLALQEAISQLEAHVQAGNIFLLKLRSLMLAAFPQSTNKVATTMLVAAAAFAFMPFRIIFVLILLEAYTRHMPLRKKSSEKLVRRLREWWLRIPAAPVQLLRPHDSRRWRSRRR
uniref:Uncharacterized protein n=1 Tax=Aegilops tauschii TaxID=37682 RepID=M8C3S3_AEGTA